MPTRAAHPKARASLLAALTATVLAATGTPALAATDPGHPMDRAFARAAEEFDVPRDLLAAVGYGETRLDGHAGRPSQANGFGVMHLVSNPAHHTLERAAALTGEPLATLRSETGANILGGAAVLRGYADTLGLDARDRDDLDAWYPAVARYSGTDGPAAALYADTVYTFLADGLDTLTPDGERITVTGRPVSPHKDGIAAADTGARSADYPAALWVPADPNNYATGRTAAIDKVVVHVTQGSYAGSISWFQDPVSEVSAHYVVRSSDGQITQMVRDADTAYHARSANASALGIEHEGFIDDPSWFTDSMYRSSAALTAYLCDRYGIPKDRAHIIGHSEAPGNDHTDPGPYWDWNRYMELVGGTDTGGGSRDGLSFDTYTTQRTGSAGPQVKALQLLLNEQGYPAGDADGSFGPATAGAVTSFQAARGLEADGVVGARTWTALLSAGSSPVLAEGATGEDVKRLQRALTAALGSTVAADGSFGPATATAV
ncbi:N-acetylmuramoyl-L-alanine amidase, partial [Streptomyces sp. NPDC057509]